MTRLTIVFTSLTLAACSGGKGKPPTTGGSGSGTTALAKRWTVGWGIKPVDGTSGDGAMTDVYLQVTDETSHQVSRELGRYKGTCTVIKPAADMNALTGVACLAGGGGTELHAVYGKDELAVLKLGVTPGQAGDPLARSPVTTMQVPIGINVVGE